MKQIAIEILEKIIPPTISALLATWVAVRLALNRYKKESLWARKLDAYTKILDCLHICRLNAEHQVDVYRIGTERSNEYQEKMRHKVSDAHSELAKVVDAGSLIISDAVANYLKEKIKPREKDWNNDPPDEFWEAEEALMENAITQIKILAKKELKS